MLQIDRAAPRARGLRERVTLRRVTEDCLGFEDTDRFELAIAFWVVHEVKDQGRLFAEVRDHLAPGGVLLVCEPKMHVRPAGVAEILAGPPPKLASSSTNAPR